MKLAKEVKKITGRGKLKEDPENFLKLLELIKQVTAKDEEFKEELEIEKIVGQIIITDRDFAWWSSMGDSVFDYGEGETDNPNFTMKATWEILGEILSMEVDGVDAYMSGELVIEGDLEDLYSYSDIMRVAIEAMQRVAG